MNDAQPTGAIGNATAQDEQGVTTLADELPRQQERCRNLLKLYEEIGVAGAFAAAFIRLALREAEQAAASGDVVRMLLACEELKGFKE